MLKINKSAIIRDVLKSMPEPWEIKKVLAAANARLDQMPADERNGVTPISDSNVSRAIWAMKYDRKNSKVGKKTERKDKAVVAVPALPIRPAEPDTLTVRQLLDARLLLKSCGESLSVAQTALKTVAQLVVKE